MNIRDWPMGDIMQLPDGCFGRRFPVFVEKAVVGPAFSWDIAELALPERCVMWFLSVEWYASVSNAVLYRLALGDQLPLNVPAMSLLEPLVMGMGTQGPEPRSIPIYALSGYYNIPMRMPIQAVGRRLVIEVEAAPASEGAVRAGIVVSSIPTEVPDCLISEYLRSR